MTFMNTIRRNCLKGPGNIYLDSYDAIWYYWMSVIQFLQYFVIVFRCTVIYKIMHELPWITILGSRVRRFANDCHEWQNHEWKSLANRLTSDPKIVIHGKKCIILFLTRYSMSWVHNSARKQLSIADFAIDAADGLFWICIVTSPQLICDVTRTHSAGIVTSYSPIVAARANWRKIDLH